MATGRRPQPTALKILRGNPGRRPLPKNEPQPTRPETVPPPFAWLDEDGQQHWHTLAPVLYAAGCLTNADLHTLAELCSEWALIRRCNRALVDGLTCETPHGLIVRPEIHIRAKAGSRWDRLAGELGLTPASRSRIKTAVDPAQYKQSKWTGLLKA